MSDIQQMCAGAQASLVEFISGVTPGTMLELKISVALVAIVVLSIGSFAWVRRQAALRCAVRGALALSGLFSLILWWNLFAFNFPERLHTWDLFHYFVGTKYFDQLGYTNLYRCVVVADQADGFVRAPMSAVRDLETNAFLTVTEVLADPGRCTAQFAQGCWDEFRRDVAWFREVNGERWERVVLDHGYNPTPIWRAIAAFVVRDSAPSRDLLERLVLLDELLLAVMWIVIISTFPLEAWAVAAVFWGTNALAHYGWTGGALLRHDWLFATVLGVAALKRERWGLAGGLLALATGLRVFPGVLLAMVGAWLALRGWHKTMLWAPLRRYSLSALLTLGLLFSVSQLTTMREGVWSEFVMNLRKHSATRIGNQIGLRGVLTNVIACRGNSEGGGGKCDLGEVPQSGEISQAAAWLIFGTLVSGALLVTFVALRQSAAWRVAVIAAGAVPIVTTMASYYAAMFLLFGLLAAERRAVGITTAALALLTQLIAVRHGAANITFLISSVLVLATVLAVVGLVRRNSGAGAEP